MGFNPRGNDAAPKPRVALATNESNVARRHKITASLRDAQSVVAHPFPWDETLGYLHVVAARRQRRCSQSHSAGNTNEATSLIGIDHFDSPLAIETCSAFQSVSEKAPEGTPQVAGGKTVEGQVTGKTETKA